ncbi:EAL domain-containing protein [Pantoea sp. Acro-835]|uniref:EAL domain-containing protein n=2 Tax=Candidatus Pantoea multigeneris TaxID=2608357 RepID=A0ABX0RD94_9GAMM|nr:EAL domain-containing protein [Pantoea multigeneris]
MLGWDMGSFLADNMGRKFILEPIVSQQLKVIGFELLSRFYNQEAKPYNTIMMVRNLSSEGKRQLLYEQLKTVSSIIDVLEENNLFVSINVDDEMIKILHSDLQLNWMFTMSKVIRLEVSEEIDLTQNLTTLSHMRDLKEKGVSFFLDDLGNGFANLDALHTGIFDAAKIDKNFFWQQKNKLMFPVIIKNIKKLCENLIIEGVENDEDMKSLSSVSVYGMQGYHFNSIAVEDIKSYVTNAKSCH